MQRKFGAIREDPPRRPDADAASGETLRQRRSIRAFDLDQGDIGGVSAVFDRYLRVIAQGSEQFVGRGDRLAEALGEPVEVI